MEHSPAVCLRLIDDFSQSSDDHYCSLCLFFGSNNNNNHNNLSPTCSHRTTTLPRSTTPGAHSDCTFHTAVTWRSSSSTTSTSTSSTPSSTSSAATLRATPPLRRKSSPTQISLRDLESEHARWNLARALQQQQSEEALRRVYERQMVGYLEGGWASWAEVGETMVGRGGREEEERRWEEEQRWRRQQQQQRWTTLTPVLEGEGEVEVDAMPPPQIPPRAPGRRRREVRF